MGETMTATHRGSCQCGAVQFVVEASLDAPFRCDCSYCRRRGAVLQKVPAASVHLLKGEGSLASYHCHYFCKCCGSFAFTRPLRRSKMAVNLRCVDALEGSYLSPLPVDGCS